MGVVPGWGEGDIIGRRNIYIYILDVSAALRAARAVSSAFLATYLRDTLDWRCETFIVTRLEDGGFLV